MYPNIERIFIYSKLKLRENPQLTPPTLQIQYCYSLIHSRNIWVSHIGYKQVHSA